jgi:hypothetical protein
MESFKGEGTGVPQNKAPVLSQITRYRELLTPVSPKQGTGVRSKVWEIQRETPVSPKQGTGVKAQKSEAEIQRTSDTGVTKIKAPVSKHKNQKYRDPESK